MPTINQYTLSRLTQGAPDNDGGMLALVSPTTLYSGNNDNYQALDQSIGFTFELAGASYTILRAVNVNGFVRLSTTNIDGDDPTLINALSGSILICPWWADTARSGAAGALMRTELLGTAPNRIRVVQWDVQYAKQASGIWAGQWTGERINFQLCLYESGNVEFRYGTADEAGSPPTPIGPTKQGAVGVKLNTTGGQSGNIRDFLGTTGTPAGSLGPFTTHTIIRGGIDWPGHASNTSGLGAYNFRFAYVPPAPTLTLPDLLWLGDTTGYTDAWSVDVTVGSDTETFSGSGTTALEAVQALLDWLADEARAWYPMQWDATLTKDAAAGAVLSVTGSDAWTWEADGDNPLGIPTTAPSAATTLTAAEPAEGTWCPSALSLTGRQAAARTGDAGSGVAVMRGTPGTTHLAPRLEAVATPVETGRLSECLAVLANPRVCHVQDRGVWRTLALGRVSRQAAGTMHYRLSLDVAEEV